MIGSQPCRSFVGYPLKTLYSLAIAHGQSYFDSYSQGFGKPF